MVLCIESYIGDPESKQGVKLEDQFVVHANSVERLTTYPMCSALKGLAVL
jgi:hypothetical protein